ncbi:MAG TPA: dihydroorotase [Firmicutes bacterium]|nr:dihydroorotase [Bacillota bacterium]
MDLLLRGGFLCDPSVKWVGPAEILIRHGLVEAVSRSIGPVDVPVLSLGGRTVLPGLIDMHVHLREPGMENKETIATGCAAAVAGGFTAVACMPNTSPPVDNKETVIYIKERAARTGLARVYPIGAITAGLRGRELSAMDELAAAGVKGFSDDGRPVSDSKLMLQVLRFARVLGLPILSHSEDLSLAAGGVVHAGATAYRLGLPVIPAAAEAAAVARDLLLQRETGGRLHLAHLSSKLSVSLLAWARQMGIAYSAEVTPHHLLLTEAAVDGFNTAAKMNPPLRDEADRAALREGLSNGLIDVIATDHAPHHAAEKEEDFKEAPFGVSGLETAFPLLFSHLAETGIVSLSRLVSCLSTAPARILGVPGGTLAPGTAADLTVIDTWEKREVNKGNLYSLGKNTPFHGWVLRGFPVLTLVEGDMKMCRGVVKGMNEDFDAVRETVLKEGRL